MTTFRSTFKITAKRLRHILGPTSARVCGIVGFDTQCRLVFVADPSLGRSIRQIALTACNTKASK